MERRQRSIVAWIAATLVALVLVASDARAGCTAFVPAGRPAANRVDPFWGHTDFRFQGDRGSCTQFATIAALEYEYAWAGTPGLDLSEEFINYLGKISWISPLWTDIEPAGPAKQETQLGWSVGGSAQLTTEWMIDTAIGIPEDTVMPYVESVNNVPDGYQVGAYNSWADPYWQIQRNTSDFNLIGTNADFANPPAFQNAIEAGKLSQRYYAPASCQRITPANSEAQIEEVVANGYTVIVDVSNYLGAGAHAVLIVGYDRSAASRSNWIFTIKNSWCPDPNNCAYARVPYDQILPFITSATVLNGVRPVEHEPAYDFIGRWMLSFDGHHGVLDIYHLPHMFEGLIARCKAGQYPGWNCSQAPATDQRLGSFYDDAGNAYRVNGEVAGSMLWFEIDFAPANANLEYDELPWTDGSPSGRRFLYLPAGRRDGRPLLAGWHNDGDGSQWSGYAIKILQYEQGGYLGSLPAPGGAWTPESFIGFHQITSETESSTLEFKSVDDSFLSPAERTTYTGLRGRYRPNGGAWGDFTAKVKRSDPATIRLHLPSWSGERNGHVFSHERGIFAGDGFVATRRRTASSCGALGIEGVLAYAVVQAVRRRRPH